MALQTNQLFKTVTRNPTPRLDAKEVKIVKFATSAGAEKLVAGVPVAFDDSVGQWTAYTKPTSEVSTITADATPATAGTFTLTIDGATTGNIAFDATAAQVQDAIEATIGFGHVNAVQTTGTDLGDANAVVTLNWQGDLANKVIVVTADFSGLTGNVHVLAESVAGVNSNGKHVIRGFVYGDDDVQLSATDEVLGLILISGEVHRDDINTAAVRALLGGSPSEADLDNALRGVSPGGSPSLRELGITVRGLTTVR